MKSEIRNESEFKPSELIPMLLSFRLEGEFYTNSPFRFTSPTNIFATLPTLEMTLTS